MCIFKDVLDVLVRNSDNNTARMLSILYIDVVILVIPGKVIRISLSK